MAFDGNGNWVSNYYPVAGTKIEAGTFNDTFIADLEASFENCITRDGQGKTTTDFNVNNNRVINVSNPSQPKDAVNKQTADATNATCVHLSGTETITGNKTFSGSTTMSGATNLSNATVKLGADLNANSKKITNLSNPSSATDAVNKQTMESNFSSKVPASVGSSTKPVYTNASGVITASNSTVGSTSKPVYMNGGTITVVDDYMMRAPNYSGLTNIGNSYTAPSNGWVQLYFCIYDSTAIVNVDGVQAFKNVYRGQDHGNETLVSGWIPVRKGASITATYAKPHGDEKLQWLPCR